MRILALTVAAALPQAAAQEADLPQHPSEVLVAPARPFVPPPPTRIELAGGARALLVEEHEEPLIDGTLLFSVGSVHEPAEKAGLVALLAEALREGGSERESGDALDEWLDAHGATLEIEGGLEIVRVDFSCLSEDLAPLLERAGDLLRAPAYPPQAIENGRRRLLTEIERRDDDLPALADRVLLRVVYGERSPFAREPSPRTVGSLGRDDLLGFHRAHLGRDRLVAGLAGDAEPEALRAALEAALEGLGQVGPPPEVAQPSFIQPARTGVFVYDRPGVPTSELRIAAPGTRRLSPDYSALFLWSNAVGSGGMTNRMMVRVRVELGLAYTVGAYFRPEWERAGRMEAFCSTSNVAVGRAAAAMVEVLSGAVAALPAAELQAVRSRVLNAEVFQVDRPVKVMQRALALDFHGYPPDFWRAHSQRLRDLTPEDVATALKRHLDVNRLVVVAVGPARELAGQLEGLGPVTVLEPPDEIDAALLIERMFGAIGGRELWAATRYVEAELRHRNEGGTASELHVWNDLERPATRVEQVAGELHQTLVLNEERALMRTDERVIAIEGERHALLVEKAWHDLHRLLRQLALGPAGLVRATGPRTLEFVGGPSRGLRLELDDGWHPLRALLDRDDGGGAVVFGFEGWRDFDGLPSPTRIRKSPDGWTREFKVLVRHESLEADLFDRP